MTLKTGVRGLLKSYQLFPELPHAYDSYNMVLTDLPDCVWLWVLRCWLTCESPVDLPSNE